MAKQEVEGEQVVADEVRPYLSETSHGPLDEAQAGPYTALSHLRSLRAERCLAPVEKKQTAFWLYDLF